ncbi:MAG: acetate--CoA ligase family protein [Chloroflexota bacterium]|nr:acetate--CoA ligase family protein [Chloroflexota bacterium]MDE3193563.1 acetate--CoA ligase family protein [Chloroflexota bacterium]
MTALAYPADVVLRDGSTVRIRPVAPGDRDAILAMLRSLSPEARELRFFSRATDLATEAARAVDCDGSARVGLVAVTGLDSRIVAHAGYFGRVGESAEVAFAVADGSQGHGIATILLGQLSEIAERNAVGPFEALVAPENARMIEVLRESGLPVRTRTEPGWIRFEFPTSLSESAIRRYEQREAMAARAAIGTFLAPNAVAVIGASRERGTIGGAILHGLVEYGFTGAVYPVNPKASSVGSIRAYASILDVPGPVDLAVVVVPAAAVAQVARECAEKRVRALVIISAGFSEVGEAGVARQHEVLEICRAAGMRVIGPNCMGIMNTDPTVRLNATFAPLTPPAGRIGFLSQSGALGIAVIDHAAQRDLGLSSFISVGNKADISGNDALQYWESDPRTDVILLYLESFGNPRKFARITRRLGRTKPIVAVKSGRSVAGSRATSSHTGALIATSDVTVDALFRDAGVIRTDTLAELFDVAELLVDQPLPTGRGVGILTNAGGPAILCADACEARGLSVPALSPETQAELRSFLPADAAVAGPVDMIASATPEQYARAIHVLAADAAVHALIVLFTPPLVTRPEQVATAIRDAVRTLPRRVPVLSVFLSAKGVPREMRENGVRIPAYTYPEDAARALAHVAEYAERRARPQGEVPPFDDARRDEASSILARALARGGGWLEPDEVRGLFLSWKLPLVRTEVVATPDDAARVAATMDVPVALKAVAPGVIHKTEAGAVRLDVAPSEVRAAASEVAERIAASGARLTGFVVQPMAASGVEMLVGVVHDPLFGPVVACGAGGTAVELLKDVKVHLTPLADLDAKEMVRSLATFPLLQGYRGAPATDVGALEDVVLRIAAMADEHPEIAELDANPVIVSACGATIVDARVRVAPPGSVRPLAAR